MKLQKHREIVYYIAGVFLLFVAFAILSFFRGKWLAGEPTTQAGSALSMAKEIDAVSDDRGGPLVQGGWYVYITGEVVRPGVYEVSPGDRIFVAVEKAGGFTENADAEKLNLAMALKDSLHITVPPRFPSGKKDISPLPEKRLPARVGFSASGTALANASGMVGTSSVVDVNMADGEELKSLPGIGPVLARRILETRAKLGRFSSMDDILQVPGIGTKRLEKIAPFVTFGISQ